MEAKTDSEHLNKNRNLRVPCFSVTLNVSFLVFVCLLCVRFLGFGSKMGLLRFQFKNGIWVKSVISKFRLKVYQIYNLKLSFVNLENLVLFVSLCFSRVRSRSLSLCRSSEWPEAEAVLNAPQRGRIFCFRATESSTLSSHVIKNK